MTMTFAQDLNRYTHVYNLMTIKNTSSTNILHYPQLDTVLMVERYIHKHSGEFKKKALWQHLPKKMMYQTYCLIIDYLLYSRKISVDSEGKIGWITQSDRKVTKKEKELFWR